MTNGEPEPFRMSTNQDADEPAGEAPADRDAEVPGDRDVEEGDRDGDVEDGDVEDGDEVWTAIEDASSSQDVWSEDPVDGDVWADDAEQRRPPTTADPSRHPEDDPVEESTVSADGPAVWDDEDEPDDHVWTLDVTQDAEETDDAEAPLAETANPRSDAGWHDLETDDEPSWSVPDLPLQRRAEDEEDVEDDAPWSSGPVDDVDVVDDVDDDAPWSSGTADSDEDDTVDMPADVVSAQVHDALGDLLGHDTEDTAFDPAKGTTPVPTEETTPVPAEDAAGGSDPLDQLTDLDLDQFDDLGDSPGGATPEAPEDADHEETPDEDADDEDADEDADDEQSLDASTAAREVMEPGNVSFSSGGKKKKRGLFG